MNPLTGKPVPFTLTNEELMQLTNEKHNKYPREMWEEDL